MRSGAGVSLAVVLVAGACASPGVQAETEPPAAAVTPRADPAVGRPSRGSAPPPVAGAPSIAETRPAAASSGSGTGTFSINDRVRGEAFRQRNGDVEHARLIVLWRGQPNWFRGQSSGGSMRTSGRSSMGGGGFESSQTRGGLTLSSRYDGATGEVYVNGTLAGTIRGDSTMIVMVDRVDSIGGPPVISTLQLPPVSGAHVRPARDIVDSVTGTVTGVPSGDNVRRFLESIPVTREFIR
jgi:hypothetical protein